MVGETSFDPQMIVDDQIVIGFRHSVVVLDFRVDEWTVDVADRLYAESTALTHANPHTIVRISKSTPDASVRRRLAKLQKKLDAEMSSPEGRRVAVITDSSMVRGAMTALRWLTGDQLKGFPESDVEGAARWTAGEDGDALGVAELCSRCFDHTAA